MARCTRSAVALETLALPLRNRETVILPTPANCATSAIVVVWRNESFCLRFECGISQTNTGETYSSFPDFTPATKSRRLLTVPVHTPQNSSADRIHSTGVAKPGRFHAFPY